MNEEQEYRAEAEAFEKLRNEYNTNVKELENLERDRSKSSVSLREAEKISSNPGLRPLNFHPGREVLFMKFVLQVEIETMKIGKRG